MKTRKMVIETLSAGEKEFTIRFTDMVTNHECKHTGTKTAAKRKALKLARENGKGTFWGILIGGIEIDGGRV